MKDYLAELVHSSHTPAHGRNVMREYLQRSHPKGRDIYDLLWYLSDRQWPAPNWILLNNALQQTGWTGKPLDESNWRAEVRKRLDTVAWQPVMNDVLPFLEPSADPNLLTHDNLLRLLS